MKNYSIHSSVLMLATGSFALLVGGRLSAQDLDRVMPDAVPQLVEPVEGISPAEAAERFRRENLGALPGETEMVAALNGLIILSDEAQLDQIQLQAGQSSNLSAYPQWNTPVFQEVVSSYVGLPVSQESLKRLQTTIRLHLSELGKPFSVVYTPPQDITDGIVQIVIRESQLGEVRVEGNEYFSEQSYLSRLKIEAGTGLDLQTINQGIDRINSNSFRSAALNIEKGSEPGTTDVVIQARERRPIRFFAGYNNTGSQTTKEDRAFTGFNWGNAFGLAHQMTLQWTSDPEAQHSKALSGNYTIDLPRNQSITAFGAYSEIVSIPEAGVEQEGKSWQTGLNYSIPLKPLGQRYTHSLQLGLDFKYSDNNLEFSLPPFFFPLSQNETNVVQARARYQGTLQDEWGFTNWGLGITASPGELTNKNSNEAFNASRAFATADYFYGKLDLYRNTDLRGALDGWNWTARFELQLSNGNLLSSEGFSTGGSNSVRGYEEGEVIGDNGVLLSQELLLPVMNPAKDFFDSNYPDSLRLFVFQDYARTWNVDTLLREKPFNLSSYGLGFRYQFAQYATLNISHGWQLKDSGSSDTGDNRRAHISFQISY